MGPDCVTEAALLLPEFVVVFNRLDLVSARAVVDPDAPPTRLGERRCRAVKATVERCPCNTAEL